MTSVRIGAGAHGLAGTALRKAEPRSPWAAVIAAWRRHRDLLDNAGSLVASTGVTSLLGAVYWMFSSRVFTQEEVGYGSAAISAMTLLGEIGIFGLGTLLIGELPRRTARAGLVSAALLACGLGSLVLGLGFALVAPHVNENFARMIGTPGRAALFAAGVAVTGVTLVFDQATIGLMRGGIQLGRNIAFAVVKLLALPAAAIILHDQFGAGITLSWVAGMALSLVLVAVRLWFAGEPVLTRPDWGILRGLGKTAMAHNWLNLGMTLPYYLLPVLVTLVVSPAANAAYYIALMLSGFLFIVPSHLSTVLFAVVASDPAVVARKLRFALRVSFIIGLPGMTALILGAHLALGLFGRGYAAEATLPLCLLALSYPATVPKALYVAVCRASGKISRAAVVLTTCSSMEIAAAAAGGVAGGLKGLAIAMLTVRYAEALVTTLPVIRAAFGHGRHRRAESAVAATGSGSHPRSEARNEAPHYPTPIAPKSLRQGNGYHDLGRGEVHYLGQGNGRYDPRHGDYYFYYDPDL
jgi:O-antigen/teichoic acid export membrane protein